MKIEMDSETGFTLRIIAFFGMLSIFVLSAALCVALR